VREKGENVLQMKENRIQKYEENMMEKIRTIKKKTQYRVE
jgi:hypothetical protein